jgi:DNA repair exonuclease SbcCD ATPase subunit
MRLVELRLKDVCQHQRLTVPFAGGVNGIIGPNGRGKSNMVNAIEFALTGVWPGWGTKDRKIRRGCEKATVELDFLANGKPGTVSRALHNSTSSLKYDGEVVRGFDNVNTRLAAVLGAGSRVLGTYVFVHQDMVNQVLLARSAERAKYFQVLFGTDYCERVRDQLYQELQANVPTTMSAERDTINARLQETQIRVDELEHLAAGAPALLTDQEVDELSSQIGAAMSARVARDDPDDGLNATGQKLLEVDARVAEHAADIAKVTGNAAEIRTALAEVERDLIALRSQVDQAAAAEAYKQLIAQLDDLRRQVAARPEPVMEPDRDSVMDLYEHAELKVAEDEVRRLQGFVDGFAQGQCPTCGTSKIIAPGGLEVDLAAKYHQSVTALQELRPVAEQERRELDAYRERRRKSLSQHAVWVVWHEQMNERVLQVTAQLASTPTPPPAADATQARQTLETYEQAKQCLVDYETRLASFNVQLARAQAEQSQLSERFERLKALAVPDVAPQQARLTAHWDHRSRVAEAAGRLQEVRKTLDDLTDRKRELDRCQQQNEGIVRYRQLLSEAHGLLHRDNFPAAVSRRFFARLNAGWNQLLRVLDVPYSVRIQDDTSIMLTYPDGEFFIEEASGGQKCCASISFLMAVNRLFAGQVGLLVLDEPTYGPDADHIERIRELMLEVQKYAASTDMQILVVTHEQRLREGFNNLIEIGL